MNTHKVTSTPHRARVGLQVRLWGRRCLRVGPGALKCRSEVAFRTLCAAACIAVVVTGPLAARASQSAASIVEMGELLHRPSMAHPVTSGSSFPPPPAELAPTAAARPVVGPPWASESLVLRYAALLEQFERAGLSRKTSFAAWLTVTHGRSPLLVARLLSIHRWVHSQR
jgi:hypothetical protein